MHESGLRKLDSFAGLSLASRVSVGSLPEPTVSRTIDTLAKAASHMLAARPALRSVHQWQREGNDVNRPDHGAKAVSGLITARLGLNLAWDRKKF